MSGEAAAAAPRAGLASHPIRGDLVRLGRLAGPVVVSRLGVMTGADRHRGGRPPLVGRAYGAVDPAGLGRAAAVGFTVTGCSARRWAAIVISASVSAGLLLARFWMLARRD